MTFQSNDFILNNPVSPGFDLTGVHTKLYCQSDHSTTPPPRSSYTDLTLSKNQTTAAEAEAKKKRKKQQQQQQQQQQQKACHRYSDTCSSMSNVDDSESVWTFRTSSGMTTPDPRVSVSSAEQFLHLRDIDCLLKRRSNNPIPSNMTFDVSEPDLNCRSDPFRYGFNNDTLMDRDAESVFLPVATEGKRKRTLSQSGSADDGSAAHQQTADRSRESSPQTQQQHQTSKFSLTSMMNTLLGGIPSKVWNFCCESSFRGFHAGGGKGYELKAKETSAQLPMPMDADRATADTASEMLALGLSHQPEEMHPSLDHFRANNSVFGPRQAFPSDGLGSPWIVVKEDDNKSNNSTTFHSDHRRVPTATSIFSAPATTHVSSVLLRNDSAGPPPRKHPRRNTIIHPVTPRPRRINGLGSNRIRQTLSASRVYMAPRSAYAHKGGTSAPRYTASQWEFDYLGSPSGSARNSAQIWSPATLEAQRLAAQVRRQEREEDASLRRFNQQLKAMIKEGQEALGSQVKITDDFE
ncbi:hypothetical protein KEM54_003726 [Ascosphaera aggregata]|nr:hypothetical protein KEM54_003726 [Ascosphaera aggregata]